jgi:importin subunit beta-1
MNEMITGLLTFVQANVSNQLKPAILETFGDLAQALGSQFGLYLSVVVQVLQQASSVTVSDDVNMETMEYIVSLREGVMDAWGGILLAYKGTPHSEQVLFEVSKVSPSNIDPVNMLQPYVESIFQILHVIYQDTNRSEGLMRATMGVIG